MNTKTKKANLTPGPEVVYPKGSSGALQDHQHSTFSKEQYRGYHGSGSPIIRNVQTKLQINQHLTTNEQDPGESCPGVTIVPRYSR